MMDYKDLKKWEDEEFKPINDCYIISNYGRVFSLNFKPPKELSLYEQSQSRIYKRVKIKSGGKYKSFLVHRLVAKAFIPNANNKSDVNHINGVKDDNRVSNLEWSTSGDNQRHAYKNGLRKPEKGSSHPKSKLTEPIVERAKDMMRRGFTVVYIAMILKVSASALYKVKSGNTWSHIK